MAARSCMVRFTNPKRSSDPDDDPAIEIGATDTVEQCIISLKGAIGGDTSAFVLKVRSKGDKLIVATAEQIIGRCIAYATNGTAPYAGSSWDKEEQELEVEVSDLAYAKKAKLATEPDQKTPKRKRCGGPELTAILEVVRKTCPVTKVVPGEPFKLLLTTEAEKLPGGAEFYANCTKAAYMLFLEKMGNRSQISYQRFVTMYNRHLSDNNSKFKKYHKDKAEKRALLEKKRPVLTAEELRQQLRQWATANNTVSKPWKAMKRSYKYELADDDGTTIKLPSARRVACEKLELVSEFKPLVEKFDTLFPPNDITPSGEHDITLSRKHNITLSGKHISKGSLAELFVKTPSPNGATAAGPSGSGGGAAASGACAASANEVAAADHAKKAAALAELKDAVLARAAAAKAEKAAEKREKEKARRLAKAEAAKAAKVEAVANTAKGKGKGKGKTTGEAPSRKRTRSGAGAPSKGKKVVEDQVDNSDGDSDDVPLAKQAKGTKGKAVEPSDSEDLEMDEEGVSSEESG